MNKYEFLTLLRERLSVLPTEDVERSVGYYSEMIDDRIEDGLSEEEAVAALGDINDIVNHILADSAASKCNVPKAKPKRKGFELKPWMIAAIVLGSPIWLSLLFGLFFAVVGIIISICSIFISLYATVFAFMVGAVGCVAGAFLFDTVAESLLAVGIAMMLAGGSILLLFMTNWLLKCKIKLVKKIYAKIKAYISKRRAEREAV